MQAAAGVPILHIVDAAAADLRRCGIGPGTIGVMGTAGDARHAALSGPAASARAGTASFPTDAEMRALVTPAIARVKANRVADAYAPLAEVANRLAARGASAVVLGCTEIPLGIQAGPQDALLVPAIDTIDALARAAIAWARG